MKIVILDGYTLNPGDLSWDGLKALGSCEFHDRTPPEKIVERSSGAQAILVNKVKITKDIISQLSQTLKYVGVLATGYDNVDVATCKSAGITVTNVPGYSTDSVAQLVFALMIELTHHVGEHNRLVQQGEWSRCPDFAFWKFPLIELSGKNLGIIGYGKIGKAVAKIAEAFGMKVLVHSRTKPADLASSIGFVSLDDLLGQSDFISLHCPLTDQARNMINEQSLAKMKKSAFLINTGRGALIDESALRVALEKETIAGAAIDVLSKEPPPIDHPLIGLPNCIVTPHFGWATREARERLMNVAVNNLKAFFSSKPVNIVNVYG